MNSNLKKIIMTALFAALACVATMSIRIPTPGTGGYIHPGDAIVILAGIILGPVYGMLAGFTRRCAVTVRTVTSQLSLEVLQISHSSPVDILSASSSCMEAALLQVSLLILSRESADLLSLLYYIRY